MKGRKGNPGLVGKLLDKSIEAFILALETINRLSIKYRVETFCYLVSNSWELLLKAKIRDDSGLEKSIYYPKQRNKPRRSLSLRDAVKEVIPNEKDPIRRNIEAVADIRDESAHLIISDVPQDVLGVFQASVINFNNKLKEWFEQSLSDRVTLGMMTIVYDIDPRRLDLSSAQMRSSLPKATYDYLVKYQRRIEAESKELGNSPEFRIGIDFKLVLTKDADKADISLSVGDSGEPVKLIEVPRDSSQTHPYLYYDVFPEVNRRIGANVMGVHDMKCIVKIYAIRRKNNFFYQGKFRSSPGQYSEALVEWLVDKYNKDKSFFQRCRAKYREAQ